MMYFTHVLIILKHFSDQINIFKSTLNFVLLNTGKWNSFLLGDKMYVSSMYTCTVNDKLVQVGLGSRLGL